MDGEHPEWLPVDWKVCVRVRSSGKKDKYYVNPSNDLKFNSKPEVLRYLKNSVKGRKLNKVDIKKAVAERLPSGWTEEIRITRKGGKTRRDPYYMDPVSRRHFRSTQEVKRYLETKNSGKADPSEELGDHYKSSTAGAEGQKLNDEEVDKTSSVDESIKSVENINPPPETDASEGIAAALRKKRKKNSKWMNGLPRRASKRLSRVQVKSSSGGREEVAARLPGQAEVNTKGKSKVPEVNTSCETTTNLAVAQDLNDIFMDPCIQFAIKTLTGAIPLEEVSKIHEPNQPSASSSGLPSTDIWADPCFEFAVKTLTSETPSPPK